MESAAIAVARVLILFAKNNYTISATGFALCYKFKTELLPAKSMRPWSFIWFLRLLT